MTGLMKCFVFLSAVITAWSFSLGPNDVVFHLYTRANPTTSEPLLPFYISILGSINFNFDAPTIITIHGHGESVSGNFNAFVVPAHLTVEDVNVIAVDWSVGSGMYSEGLANAPQAGRVIASFVAILQNDFGYSSSSIRIVGHGLGGHIAGIAANNINGDVPHIIALDPSFDGWTHHPERLSPDDAEVVEVVHTASGTLGYDFPLGDLDFYANGGSLQFGCAANITCSHQYSYVYYAESILVDVMGGNKFVGTACDDYENAIVLECSGDSDVHFGGTEVKQDVTGIYAFITNMQPPFARG